MSYVLKQWNVQTQNVFMKKFQNIAMKNMSNI